MGLWARRFAERDDPDGKRTHLLLSNLHESRRNSSPQSFWQAAIGRRGRRLLLNPQKNCTKRFVPAGFYNSAAVDAARYGSNRNCRYLCYSSTEFHICAAAVIRIGGEGELELFAEMIGSGRVRLKGWQQAAVAVGSAVGALLDPRRADLIAALGETTGKPAFERVLERMRSNPEGKAVLLDRPRVISTNVGHAWDLPPNTFGAAYAKFMGSRNFSPDDRPPVRFMDTDELAYVATRAREVHDFWHTLFGLPTNLIGESALKVIEFEQMLLPMCALSVLGGSARFGEKQRKLFYQHYFPWALRAGMRCTDLMCVYYERHFHEDLEDVRQRWGITPAPAPQWYDA